MDEKEETDKLIGDLRNPNFLLKEAAYARLIELSEPVAMDVVITLLRHNPNSNKYVSFIVKMGERAISLIPALLDLLFTDNVFAVRLNAWSAIAGIVSSCNSIEKLGEISKLVREKLELLVKTDPLYKETRARTIYILQEINNRRNGLLDPQISISLDKRLRKPSTDPGSNTHRQRRVFCVV